MTVQNLPPSAREYARIQRREQAAAIAAIRRQWRRMGRDFDSSWLNIAPTVLAILSTAQRRVSASADAYVPSVLEETGQARALAAATPTNIAAFIGVTGSGYATEDVLASAPIRAKQAVELGSTPYQALASAGTWLTAASGTILSDTARAVETTGMATRPVGGYVRMLTPPSCGRCAVLAGKWFRKNQGFQRHPGCDCKHIPMSESIAGDYTLDLNAYLNGLDESGQIKLLGSRANWQAWNEYGANPAEMINAYKGGLRTAQDLRGNRIGYTGYGTSRGLTRSRMSNASRLDRDAGTVLIGGRARFVRRMPETILRTTASKEQVLRQLRLYGWVF